MTAPLVDAARAGGGPPDEFDKYERAIRREYEHVSDRDFAAGRALFLRGLLARPRIYATDTLAGRYEEAARRNLHRSVERWERWESGLAELGTL